MTRTKTYILTAVSAVLFIFLNWAFADGRFSLDSFWAPVGSDGITVIAESSLLTYLLLAAIIGAGALQASRLPAKGVKVEPVKDTSPGQADDPALWKMLMGNAYFAVLWLPVRFFVGHEWLAAGEHKIRDDAWMSGEGTALVVPGEGMGYWERVVLIPEQGRPAITYGWYRDFIQYMIDQGWQGWFAQLIAVGEFLVGIGLILGALVGIAAFFGTLMNFSFMLAGSASTNPVLFGLGVFLVLGWKVAGYFGLDRVLLPTLGAPWKAGSLIKEHKVTVMHEPDAGMGKAARA
jgi:thiosulfate dehydrogenase (quinone) large subunit